MKKFRITFKVKEFLQPYLPPIQTAEVEACTVLQAIAVILTQNEFVEIPEIIKVELVVSD